MQTFFVSPSEAEIIIRPPSLTTLSNSPLEVYEAAQERGYVDALLRLTSWFIMIRPILSWWIFAHALKQWNRRTKAI
jgi:hypothetical protein